MSAHRFLVSALSLALLATFAPSGAQALQGQAVTAASLQQQIAAAAQGAAGQPGFARLSKAQKLAAIQAAVAAALAKSGATVEQISAALVQAVASNVISAGVAISVASSVSPDLAQQVATAPTIQAQLRAEGQSANVTTASTDGGAGVSVLVNLQGATAPGGGGAAAATTTTTPTPYDPCAGVIATYCGS